MYVLEVMSGPLDGMRWRFEHEITIGRDEATVSAPIAIDRYLSRSHARLIVRDAMVELLDLSSRNGTTLDGQPIEKATLAPGKPFTCGRTLFRVLDETHESEDADLGLALARVSTVADLRARLLPKPIGFVPTMGALHEGHLRLIEAARQECASVVVSIFVNPTQFAVGEDFERYPRDLTSDLRKLNDRGVSLVFTPDAGELYPLGYDTRIGVGPVGAVYEGAARPTHFSGVATVVAKLLNIVAPTRLYLGQKDAQQIAVVRQLITDLQFPTELCVVPTDRESDGLARSSRNVYLNPQERRLAPALYRALVGTAAAFREGAPRRDAVACGHSILAEALRESDVDAEVSYIEIVDRDRFEPTSDAQETRSRALAIGALRVRTVRLIDNVPISAL